MNWLNRSIAAIKREYDRRIRRASQISEYGVQHGEQDNQDEDDEAVEIVNLPRGTAVATSAAQPND